MSRYANAANSEKNGATNIESVSRGPSGAEGAMCGIAGFALLGSRLDTARQLRAMADSIRHRGPDGEGFAQFTTADSRYTIGFAHLRLAIIDLVTGEQPMTQDGVTLIYNGEIYNYRELRDELEQHGQVFRTQSDTEVLLNAYLAGGPDCVLRLRGMFAFALWDKPRDRLMLARDHFGKKPLYMRE